MTSSVVILLIVFRHYNTTAESTDAQSEAILTGDDTPYWKNELMHI
jgi:hypothetical protein